MGILKSVAASLLHQQANRETAAEDDLRKARRSGSPAEIAAARTALGHAETARKSAERAFRNAG